MERPTTPSLDSAHLNLDEILIDVDDLDGLNLYFQEARVPLELVAPPAWALDLLSVPADADALLGLVTRGYTGQYVPTISSAEADRYLEELTKTKLATPLRFINTVWLLRGVTRAFTHQLVRYSLGTSFVQESLRFAVHERVGVLVPSRVLPNPELLRRYALGAAEAVTNYHRLLAEGAPAEDARGLLPTNTLTSVYVSATLAALVHIYDQRTCCQAQSEEWTPIMQRVRELLLEHEPALGMFLTKPWETGAVDCHFGASFDRPCRFQHEFDKNRLKVAESVGMA
jgi:hypothetical protein